MRERLGELNMDAMADRGSTTVQKCEQALAMTTLAAFLSYVCLGAPPS